MKKLRLIRLLRDLRTIWYGQPFTTLRVRRTWDLLYRFITGKMFFVIVLVVAVMAAGKLGAVAFDLLSPSDQVSNGSDIQVLVVSIDPATCPPCARMIPVVDRLKSEGYNLMTVGPHSKTRLYPTIFIFRDKKLVDTMIGFVDEKTLKAKIHAQSTP